MSRCPEIASGVKQVVAFACLLLIGTHSAAGELSATEAPRSVELTLPDLDGQHRDLREFGGRVVLVNFWASWCTPCVQEMPGIQRLSEQMRDKPFAAVAVNVAEPASRARTAAARLGIDFPVLLDTDSAAFNRWGATVLPTTYVLDGAGMIRYVGRGPLEWDGADLVELLSGLMGSGDPSAPAVGAGASAPE